MKRTIIFSLVGVVCLVLACGKESGTEDVDVEARDLSDLYGAWVLKSGDFISVGGDTTIYSQNISFVRNGNFSEELDCNYDYNWNKQDTTMYGNWSYENGRIVINDWNGKVFDNTFGIEKLTSDTLALSCGTRIMIYVKKEDEFKNAAGEIVGKWRNIYDNSGFYTFNNDGYTPAKNFKWWLEDNILVMEPTSGVISELTTKRFNLRFVNDKYLRISNGSDSYLASVKYKVTK